MRISKSAVNFNKEILFGEIGALIGAPSFGYIISHLTSSPNLISSSAVIGAVIGAAIFWMASRIYHKKLKEKISTKNFAKDIAFFTPAAFILTLLVYYPTLFFVSRYFLEHKIRVVFSVIFSQFIAFALFITAVNLYRYALIRIIGKSL